MLGALWVNACDYFILKLFNKEVYIYIKKRKPGEIYDFLKGLECSHMST